MRSLGDGTWLVMQFLVYLGHYMRIFFLVSTFVTPYGQAANSSAKNLALYSRMGACTRKVLDALSLCVPEQPICDIYVFPGTSFKMEDWNYNSKQM